MKKMKKLLSILLALTLLFALAACNTTDENTEGNEGTENNENVENNGETSTAEFSIGVIQLASHPALDAAREGFVAGLDEAGLSYEIEVLNAAGEQANCPTLATKLVNDQVDLILAIATPAAQAVAQATDTIPILVTAVTDPAYAGLVESNEAPGGNVSGTSDMNPVEDQIELMLTLAPETKTVGLLYNAGEDNSILQANLAEEILTAKNIAVEHFTASDSSQVQSVAQSMVGKVDAVYIPTDNRRLFAVVAVCYLATWLVSCFYQSFSAPIAQQCFGETSPLAGSVILALIMAPSLLGGPLVQRFEPKRTLVVSMAAVTATTALMALFVLMGAELLFMGDCALFSFAMGVAVSVSLRLLLLRVSVLRVSAILASVNLVAYAGSAVTGVVCGILLEATSFAFVFAAMAAVLVAASLFVAVCLRAPSEKKKDGRLTLSRFRKMKGMGESSAPEPATGETAPEDASVAAPALI